MYDVNRGMTFHSPLHIMLQGDLNKKRFWSFCAEAQDGPSLDAGHTDSWFYPIRANFTSIATACKFQSNNVVEISRYIFFVWRYFACHSFSMPERCIWSLIYILFTFTPNYILIYKHNFNKTYKPIKHCCKCFYLKTCAAFSHVQHSLVRNQVKLSGSFLLTIYGLG